MSDRIGRTGNPAENLDQLGPSRELATDGDIILITLAGVAIHPRKALARRRIVRLVVNAASAVAEKNAAPVTHARSDFSPARYIHQTRPVIGFNRGSFFLGECGAIAATRRLMRTGEAG